MKYPAHHDTAEFIKERLTEPQSNGHEPSNKVSSNEERCDFWYFEDEACKIDQSALIDWLEAQGICKRYEYDSETPQKIRRRGQVLSQYPDARIRDLADKHLRRQSDKRPLEAMRRGWNHYLSSTKLDAVQTIKPIFQRSTQEEAYFYYNNGYVSVTTDDIRIESYRNLTGFIWDDWRLERAVDLTADGENWLDCCEFGRFLRLVTAEEDVRTRSLVSAIGYLLHPFKDPAAARAVVLTDQKISDDPEGGTGKGIVAQALGKIVPSTDIDAKRLDLRSQFAFQSVQPGITGIVHFDDPGSRFNFNDLFPSITGSFLVEKKGRDQIVVPFDDSPKFIITSNEVLRGRGGSHERRVFELEFSDYFNKEHTPEDEFGHLLFHDWDAAEWNRFDRLMLYCVQYYLQHGLQSYEHVNLAWKKFVRNTTKEFGDFVETFGFEANAPGTLAPDQTRYHKDELIRRLSIDHQEDVTSHTLTSRLTAYAKHMGWELLNQLGHDKKEIAFVAHE